MHLIFLILEISFNLYINTFKYQFLFCQLCIQQIINNRFDLKLRIWMSAFTRKRSIDKRTKQQQSQANESLNSTGNSFRPSSSRISASNGKNFHQCLTKIQQLNTKQCQKLTIDKLQKQVSEAMRSILQLNKGVLISQKLSGYRECTILMTKYHQQWKKQGQQMNQSNSALVMNLYRNVSQQLNKLTKQQKNDQLILQANITSALFGLLESIALDAQNIAKNSKDKKAPLMRKNSLKKVSQGTVNTLVGLRPSSRGKLSTLVKRPSSKGDITDLKIQVQKQQGTYVNSPDSDMSSLELILFNTCCILKNLSANKLVRKDLLKQDYLRLINRYLLIWNQKTLNQYATNVLVQLTSAYRHIAAQQKSFKLFLKSNCFEPWTKLVEMYPTSNDVIFNMLRILSKLSANQQCCEKLNQKKQFLKTLSSFFKVYKTQIHVVIRVAYIFANMTSYLADIRTQLYFDFKAWEDIYVCFEHYANSQLKGKSEVQKMGVSMAAWDYNAMKKQSDIQALMKIIRLIANLFTVPEIGQHIYRDYSSNYRDLIKTMKILLQKKSNLEKHNQLIACVLSCLTNTLYYDRQMLLASNQYKTVKKQLIQTLVDFVVQIDNQQVCCQSLRVVSNLTRMKQFIKPVLDAKLHEAVFILLDSTSKQIVYYCLGIIINLLADDQFKSAYRGNLISSIIQILKECQNEDFDIVTVSLKALFIIIDNRTENIDPKQLSEIQSCLINLGAHCDKTMLNKGSSSSSVDIQSAQQSRNLINVLLNNMPEQKFMCPVKNCGRKFADDAKLQDHVARRHKV